MSMFTMVKFKDSFLRPSEIKNSIIQDKFIDSTQITKDQINAPLPDTGGEPPLHFAILRARPNRVDEFLKHPYIDIKTKNTAGVTAPQFAWAALAQLQVLKGLRFLIDKLSQPLKTLIKTQAGTNPPKAQNSLLQQPDLPFLLKESFKSDLYFPRAATGHELDPDLPSERAHEMLDQLIENHQGIKRSIQSYGARHNMTEADLLT